MRIDRDLFKQAVLNVVVNAIEAMGRQVVMASDSHPKMIEEFGDSLINRFVSGLVVRIDPPGVETALPWHILAWR